MARKKTDQAHLLAKKTLLNRLESQSPRTVVMTPRTSVTTPRTLVMTPRTLVTTPRTSVTTPRTLVTTPRTSVTSPLQLKGRFGIILDKKEYDARVLAKAMKNAARTRTQTKNPTISPENFIKVPHTNRHLTKQEGHAILEMTGRSSGGDTVRKIRKHLGQAKPKYTASKPKINRFDPAVVAGQSKEPLICGGKPFDLANPPPCFLEDVKLKVDEEFARKKALALAGDTVCGKENPDGSMSLSPHQRVIFDIARVLFANGMEKMNGSRGLMCYHSVGSGKTVLALCILIAAMISGKPYKVILVTTPSNKRNNSHADYAYNLYTYFPQYLKLFGLDPPKDRASAKAWSKKAGDNVAKKMQIQSYTATTWWSGGFKPNTVLIMDESQNLIVPAGEVKAFSAQAMDLRKELLKPETMKNTYVFPLSATPSAGSIAGFVTSANFVRPLGRPPFTEADPPSAYKGIVSYVELREDKSMFGQLGQWTGSKITPLTGPFHSRVQNQYFEMGNKYFLAFLKKVSDETGTEFDNEKPDEYLKILTQRSTVLSATECRSYINMAEAKKAKRAVTVGTSEYLLSNKLVAALKNITTMPGKQYIFAANPTIAKAVESGLQQIYGYSRVSTKQLDAEVKGKELPKDWEPKLFKSGKNPMRYMAYGTGIRYNPTETYEEKHIWGMKQLMSHPGNLHGEYCKIMVATQGNFEGLDIPAWRGVHIVQPLVTKDRDEQALGRALRACGHSKLPPNERTAVIIRYFSTVPKNFDPEGAASEAKGKAANIDFVEDALEELQKLGHGRTTSPNAMVFGNAIARQQKLTHFERCIRQHAIDCPLLKQGLEYDHPCGGECQKNTDSFAPSIPTGGLLAKLGFGAKPKSPLHKSHHHSPKSHHKSHHKSPKSPSPKIHPSWHSVLDKIPEKSLKTPTTPTSSLRTPTTPKTSKTPMTPTSSLRTPKTSKTPKTPTSSLITPNSFGTYTNSRTPTTPVTNSRKPYIPKISNGNYAKYVQKYFVDDKKKKKWFWPFG